MLASKVYIVKWVSEEFDVFMICCWLCGRVSGVEKNKGLKFFNFKPLEFWRAG